MTSSDNRKAFSIGGNKVHLGQLGKSMIISLDGGYEPGQVDFLTARIREGVAFATGKQVQSGVIKEGKADTPRSITFNAGDVGDTLDSVLTNLSISMGTAQAFSYRMSTWKTKQQPAETVAPNIEPNTPDGISRSVIDLIVRTGGAVTDQGRENLPGLIGNILASMSRRAGQSEGRGA